MRPLRRPNKKHKIMQVMASRIANAVLPARSFDVFSKLRKSQFNRYGDYGMALDPRKQMLAPDQYLGSKISSLPTTEEMREAQERSSFDTRDETIQRNLGMTSFAGALPNMPARQGIASAAQTTALGPQQAGSSVFVEDQSWPVTLAQMVGSGILSNEQLKAASIQNVRTLLRNGNMSATEFDEMCYMFQRFMVDGYMRGVDVTRDLRAQGGVTVRWGLTPGGSVYGLSEQGVVTFQKDSWYNRFDENDNLALFYHEFGHELLNRPHTGNTMLMGSQEAGGGLAWFANDDWHLQYRRYVDELFRAGTNGGAYLSPTNTAPQYDASWYPSATGIPPGTRPPTGSPPGTPGAPTTVTPNVNTSFNNFNIASPTVTPWSGSGSMLGGGTGGGAAPASSESTPVAGSLPDMGSTKSFAAGMAQSAGSFNDMSNIILRYLSG